MTREIEVRLEEGEVVADYRGTRLAVPAARYLETEASQGIPYRQGRLDLEYNRSLEPFRARGTSGDVGEYFKLSSSMPMVRDAISSPIAAITSAPWRIERPSLPEYWRGNARAEQALERQYQFASYVWAHWTGTGADVHWRDWINDILQFSLISGFYLGELVGTFHDVQIDGRGQRLIVPDIPSCIMPWTVEEWVFQGNPSNMIAVTQRTFSQIDAFGNAGPGIVVLPWDKVIHQAYMPASTGDMEGRSILRPAFQPLRMKQKLLQVQALGIEVNALGMVVVKQDPQTPLSEDALADLQTSLDNWTAEQASYIILPPGQHEIEFKSPSQVVPDLTSQLAALDGVIGKALGNSHKLMGISSHGSFAARSDASSEARNNYEHLGLYVARVAERVLRRFIEINFPMDAEMGMVFCPGINHAAIVEPDKQRRAATLATLVGAGLIDSTDEVKRQLLEENNLTTTEPEGEDSAEERVQLPALEMIRQGRLLGDALYLEQTQADFFRALMGMDAWTPEARDEYIAAKIQIGSPAQAIEEATDEDLALDEASTPARPEERVKGSKRNPRGTAKGTRGGIKIDAATEKALVNKVKEHNEKHSAESKQVDLGMLKAVYRRGAGAFSTSHRPGMTRGQWSMGRVNAFLELVRRGRPSSKAYTTDNDLLPKGHPKSTRE